MNDLSEQQIEAVRRKYIADGLARFIQDVVDSLAAAETERDTWKQSADALLAENTDLRNLLAQFTKKVPPVVRTESSHNSPGSPIRELPCETDTPQERIV